MKKLGIISTTIVALSSCLFHTQKNLIFIEATHMNNLFYLGVENHIQVILYKKFDSLLFEVDSGEVKIKDNKVYIIPVKNPTILTIKNKNGKTLLTTKFRVKKIPPPEPRVAGIHSGEIAKEKLSSALGMLLMLENFDFDCRCPVESYTVTRISSNKEISVVKNEEPVFNSYVKSMIHKAESGDYFIFDNISGSCNGVKYEKLSPVVLKVK